MVVVYTPGGGVFRPPFVGGESAYFLCVNRNKKSIGVNMKKAEGQEIVRDLAKHSDILMENFLPGEQGCDWGYLLRKSSSY